MRTATTATTVTMTMIPPQRKATNNNFDSFQYVIYALFANWLVKNVTILASNLDN